MYNLLRVEWKKLFRSPLFYLILGVIGIAIALTLANYYSMLSTINMENPSLEMRIQIAAYNKTIYTDGYFNGSHALYLGVSNFPVWMIAVAVMACGLAVSDFTSGTISNLLSVGRSRAQVYFSKLIMLVFCSIIFLSANIIGYTLVLTVLVGWGQPFAWSQITPAIRMFVLSSCMFAAMTSFCCMLAYMLRNMPAVVGLGFIVPVLLDFMQMLLSTKEATKAAISYFPSVILSSIALPNPAAADVRRCLITSAAIIIVTTGLGLCSFLRRDIMARAE